MKHEADWARARRLCKLSKEELKMAREMGLNPRSLIKNIPSPSQRWKAPVGIWIREMYAKRHRKSAPVRFEPPPPVVTIRSRPREPVIDWESEDIFDDSIPPTRDEIAEENRMMLRRQSEFRLAAEYVAAAFARFEAVRRIALFHECTDVDLAVWLADLSILKPLQEAKSQALNALFDERDVGVAHHQVDVLVVEPDTNRYLGRLCYFGVCPKEERECRVENCGRVPFLRQHENFRFDPNRLSPEACEVLFKRDSGVRSRIAEPGPRAG